MKGPLANDDAYGRWLKSLAFGLKQRFLVELKSPMTFDQAIRFGKMSHALLRARTKHLPSEGDERFVLFALHPLKTLAEDSKRAAEAQTL